jgi:hypothetical protein
VAHAANQAVVAAASLQEVVAVVTGQGIVEGAAVQAFDPLEQI